MKMNIGIPYFMRLCNVITLIIALSILDTTFSFGSEAQDTNYFRLNEVVVTATRNEKNLGEVPADVTIITQEDLRKKNYVNINEALETAMGVMSYTGSGIAPAPPASPVVNLRGFHGAMRTMIMVNGQPISPFLYAASLVHWTAIPVDVVERIEIVRGPFSALYGGDAVGGVINIITKSPEKFEATVRSGYGSNNTFKEHLSIGGKPLESLSVFGSYDFKKTDNYVSSYYVLREGTPTEEQAATARPVTGPTKQPYRSGGVAYLVGDKGEYDYSEHTFTFNVKLDPTESSYIKANILHSFYDIDPYGSSSYLRDLSGEEVRSGWVGFTEDGNTKYLNLNSGSFLGPRSEKSTGIYTLEYVNDITDSLRLKVYGGLTNFATDKIMYPAGGATESGGPGTFQEAPSKIWTGDLQTDYRVADWLLMTGGLSYRRDEGEYNKYSATDWTDFDSITTLNQTIEPESNRYGVYAQFEVNPIDKLTVYAGLRYDWWDSEATRKTLDTTENLEADGQDALSPKIAFVYSLLEDTTLRLSGGRAFRVPNFFELYQPLTTSGTTYQPNPNLKPEITWAWEGGIEQVFFDGWTVLSLTYFEHYTKDFIDSRTFADPDDPETTIAQRDNFGKVEVKGLEVGIDQKITDYLRGFANYTYMHAEITDNPNYPNYVGNRPRYVPDHMFNAGLDLKYMDFHWNVTTHYRSRMYTNNANDTVNWEVYGVQDEIPFITDTTIGYNFLDHYNLSFTVNNLFDNDDYFLSGRAPGRTFFGMLTARF